MATKPIVARVKATGAEYGYASEAQARKALGEGAFEIVGYQDGSAYEAPSTPATTPVSKMNRSQLEAHAATLGIENAADKDAFPNVASLREAIAAAQSANESAESGEE